MAQNVISDRKLGKLHSSYAGYREDLQGDSGHPPFTTYGDFKRFIDFITHTQEFRTVGVLEMPTCEADLEPGIPNQNYGSDHLRIEAKIEFV
jgi:RNA exonuclease NGL2